MRSSEHAQLNYYKMNLCLLSHPYSTARFFSSSQVAFLCVMARGVDGMQTSIIVEPLGTVRLVLDVMSDLLQVLEVGPGYMKT